MKRGFTLIELIITIIVLAIILSVAIPKFQIWKKREEVKKDINYLYSILQKTRSKAFFTKENYKITINGTDVRIKNSQTLNIKLNTPFYYKDNNGRFIPVELTATSRGLFSKQISIRCSNCDNLNLPYNCIIVSRYNLRISKCP